MRINRCSHCGCDEPILGIDGKLYCDNCGMSLKEELTMKKVELEPCPFCGGKADMDVGNFGGMVCYCEKCFSQGKQCETEDEAIEAWNNRRADNDN